MVIFSVNTRACTKISYTILCMWRNGLCSVELVYVFHAVSSVLPKIYTMNEEDCSTLGLGRLQHQKTCSKLAPHTSAGLTVRRYITLMLLASKFVVGLVFNGQPLLVSVGPITTRLQQGCPSNNSPTKDVDDQHLHCNGIQFTPANACRVCCKTCLLPLPNAFVSIAR